MASAITSSRVAEGSFWPIADGTTSFDLIASSSEWRKLAVTAAQVSRQRATFYYGGWTAAIGSWRSRNFGRRCQEIGRRFALSRGDREEKAAAARNDCDQKNPYRPIQP